VALPDILRTTTIARSRLFEIEELELRFANGAERTYERLPAVGQPAVMIAALDDQQRVLLIREYAAGFHEYQLTLPKGAAEAGESLAAAADRELQEECGFGARSIVKLKSLNLSPGHMGFTINVMLARDLYPKRLPADEPEPIEVVPWPLHRLDELMLRDDFAEARAVAALHLVQLAIAGDFPTDLHEDPHEV
jgi:ADP-ribose diphosphatase